MALRPRAESTQKTLTKSGAEGEEEVNNPFEARQLPAINVLLTMRKRTSSLYNELLQPVRTFKLSIDRTYQCVNAQYAHATGLFFASFA